jgi:dTDP-4-dehydrorhamnose reductase
VRALVIGTSGMVGRAVLARFRGLEDVEVAAPARAELDALDPPPLASLLRGVDLVVNAAGVLRNHPDYPGDAYRLLATRVNAVFPQVLSRAAEEAGSRIVHVSTDAVFAPGDDPADETTAVSPGEPYGLSKALGEAVSEHVVNVRCSVVGPAPGRESGLWQWFADRPPGATVEGYTRPWTGVTSRQLAVLCGDLLHPAVFEHVRAKGPSHHFVPNEAITKLELLTLMREVLRPDLTVVPAPDAGPAGRPLASTTGALNAAFSGLRDWREAVAEAAR